MIGHDFPYLDTRDLNLDWLLKNMKIIIKQWADYQTEMNRQFSDLETAFNALKAWIDSYFDNLDVQREINNKIDAMASSGELVDILEPTISDEVTAWLTAHITQPTTPVIDTSLTVAGAAADAKVTGDKISDLIMDNAVQNFTLRDNEYTYNLDGDDMVQGLIDPGNGRQSISITRICSPLYYPIYAKAIEVTVSNGYKYGLSFYSDRSESSFLGGPSTWVNMSSIFDVPDGALYFRVTLAYANDRTVTTDLFADLLANITYKAIDSNNYAIDLINDRAKLNTNLLQNRTEHKVYQRGNQNVLDNNAADIFDIFQVEANKTYYYIGIWPYFTCFRSRTNTYTPISNDTAANVSGTYTPTENGSLAVSVAHGAEALFTDSYEMYTSKWFGADYVSIASNRGRVYHVEKNMPADFTRLTDAITEATKYLNSIVYVGAGTWDLIDELGAEAVESISESNRGVYLKNGIHLIFCSDAKVTWNYSGTTQDVIDWGCVFNAGRGGFTIENGTLEASNCRYVVHDERNQDGDLYINRYINTRMKLDNSNSTNRNRQCIGGGLGKYGYVEISGCVFNSVNSTGVDVVFYHNSADPSGNAKSHIVVKDSYVDALLSFYSYGASTKQTSVEVCGCSLGGAINIGKIGSGPDNVSLLEWNNTVRS